MSSRHLMLEVPPSLLTRLDGRVKLFLSFCGLLAVVTSRYWPYPALAGVSSILLLRLAGIPAALVWRRMRPVLLVAVISGVTQVFFSGQTLLFHWHLGPFNLTGYREGLLQGILLAARVTAGMSIMLLLTLSTTVQEWVSALAWFRVPLTIVEIMTLAHSALFVLLEEMDRLQKAQRMRLGYSSWRRSIRAVSAVGGSIFTRVYDRSVRLWQAMLCRGYNGKIRVSYQRQLTRLDLGAAILGFGLILGSWLAGR